MKKMYSILVSMLFLAGGVAAVAGCGESSADTDVPPVTAEENVPAIGHPAEDGWSHTAQDHRNR